MPYLYNMATARPFAYNTGAPIAGTTQVGDLAVGAPTSGFESTGLEWWNGPDEELGYVIAQSVPSDTQPTPVRNPYTPTQNIVTNGLVIELDANINSSYSGAGTTVVNLQSPGTYDHTLNGATFTNLNGIKCFDCTTGTNKVVVNGTGPTLPTSGYTYITWARLDSDNIASFRTLLTTNTPKYTPITIPNGTNTLGYWDTEFRSSGYDLSGQTDLWVQYSVVGDSSSQTFYINNIEVGDPISFGAGGTTHWTWGNNQGPSQPFGYVANLYFYDRKLSLSEIQQQYNFLAPRFNQTASVGFFRSPLLTEESFIELAQKISLNQTFTGGTEADDWLTSNGYWSSWVDSYSYEPSVNLSWPDSSAGYTLYTGGVTNADDGFTNLPITLPTSFSTNGVSSSNLYVSTNGFFTIGSGSGTILPGPTQATPASMAANPSDNWLQPGLTMTDGDVQNVYYQTGTSGGTKYFVKLLVYGGTYGAQTSPTSWIANFYRDSTYQWLEVRAKSTLRGSVGPYNAVSVDQPSSTTSRVWRGDLNGQNWVYLGTGSVK